MAKVRFGIIGYGNMGSAHSRYFDENKVPEGELIAIADNNPQKLEKAKEKFGGKYKYFDNADEMIESGTIDAIIIAIPHYFHAEYAIKGFKAGLHVMSEKPAGVYTKQVNEMIAAAEKTDRKFGIMFQMRNLPVNLNIKKVVSSGELGEIKRVNMVFTDWYRSQSYYDSGAWRATWAGEGGGVLLNQCPHSLDLWQWLLGMMPTKIRAFCHNGKWHNIEVEDDVSAYFEYANGATGLFTTSTADTPGVTRIEITGNNGRLLAESNKLTFYKSEKGEREFNAEYTGGFGNPKHEKIEIDCSGNTFEDHPAILKNFCAAILRNEPLFVPGQEGLKGVTLSNAMHLSSWLDKTVELPFDENLFYEELQKRCKTSKFGK